MIAAAPVAGRDQSRLLVYHRKRETADHRLFSVLPEYLSPSDLLVLNDTRVIPARLQARKPSGGLIELLLLRPVPTGESWEAMVRGKVAVSTLLTLVGGGSASVVRDLGEGHKELCFDLPKGYSDLTEYLERWGEMPLPPYIVKKREGKSERIDDRTRYQTVYARVPGSAAAPTAGLHFTEALLEEIRRKGVQIATVTLHIGTGTFQPMRGERLSEHAMHREWFQIPAATAEAISAARQAGGKIIAVGTTATRALESAAHPDGAVAPGAGETGLFITPGYRFKVIDGLITNFHLPKSTLLVLVSAFAGCQAIRSVYEEAIRARYRFYSYGDAMLIL